MLLGLNFLVNIDEHGTFGEGLIVDVAILLLLDLLEVVRLVELLLFDHRLEVFVGLLVLVLLRKHVVEDVPFLRLFPSKLLQNVFLKFVIGTVQLLGTAVDVLRDFLLFDLLKRVLVRLLGVLRQMRVSSQGQIVHLTTQNLILQVPFEIGKACARNDVCLEKLCRRALLDIHFILIFRLFSPKNARNFTGFNQFEDDHLPNVLISLINLRAKYVHLIVVHEDL